MEGPRTWQGRITTRQVALAPSHPVHLGASGQPDLLVHEVADPIMCTIALIESAGQRLIMLSLDLLYPGGPLLATVEDRLSKKNCLDLAVLFATHTHFAPATDPSKPRLGEASESYLVEISDQITATVDEMLMAEPDHSVYLTVCTSTCRLGVNRRRRWPMFVHPTRVRLAPIVSGANPKGPIDDLVTVATFRDETTHAPVAVMWNYACHPVGKPRRDQISSHFVGVVRERLREDTGQDDLPVLFLQGFSGDIRPNHASIDASSNKGLRRLLLGPGLPPFTAEGYAEWTTQLASVVRTTMNQHQATVEGRGMGLAKVALPRTDFLVGSQSDADVTFKSIRFGEDLRIVGVSVEAVCAYSDIVRSTAPERWVMPAGCMDDVAGYAPTRKMLRQGGYEAKDFCRYFSASHVPDTVETAMKEGLIRVSVAR